MSAGVLTPPLAAKTPTATPSGTPWIISRQDDLIWFIGTSLVGYLVLGLLSADVSVTLLTAVWLLGIDGPHIRGTVTRTYFDKHERRRLGGLPWAILSMLLIGPIAVYAGQRALFFLFAVCWQHYHVTKQQVGFVMLWKARNQERDAFDMKVDRWFVLASGIFPLALFMIKTRLATSLLANLLTADIVATYPILLVVFAIYQFRKWRAGKPMNAPKLLLMAALIPLQWVAFGYAARFGPDGIVRAGIALGLFHSLQYHRLMWGDKKNPQGPDDREKWGLAVVLAKKFGYYLAAAAGLYFVAGIVPQTLFTRDVLAAALWGIAFMRFVLDSKIWRVPEDQELAAALHL